MEARIVSPQAFEMWDRQGNSGCKKRMQDRKGVLVVFRWSKSCLSLCFIESKPFVLTWIDASNKCLKLEDGAMPMVHGAMDAAIKLN